MSEPTPTTTFRSARHGYDPVAVDEYVAKLTALVETAQLKTAELTMRVEQLGKADAARAAAAPAVLPAPEAPTYADLGHHIGQILTLAEHEADRIRTTSEDDAKQKLADLEAANSKARKDAEQFATETRASATQDAARILEDARREADQLFDEAQRQATARREEAEALHENQRAQAAKAAADFEQTLAERRETAEKLFRERTEQAERELLAVQDEVKRLRAEGEALQSDTQRNAARTTSEAEAKAAQIVNDAVARADRIRAESERELVAATQRRDSINAQLTNVRQMLATLSGTTPGGIDAVAAVPEVPAPTLAGRQDPYDQDADGTPEEA